MNICWYDIVGTLGVTIIIFTYILLQIEYIRSAQLIYSLFNAVGAALILVSLYFSFNFPSFVVEIFWLIISLFGVGKYFFRPKIK